MNKHPKVLDNRHMYMYVLFTHQGIRSNNMQARHDNNMTTYAVFTTKPNGGFHVLFEGTLSDCEQFEEESTTLKERIRGEMRIAPIQTNRNQAND